MNLDDAAMSVLCFGDSNTYGTAPLRWLGDAQRYPRSVRWTGHLQRALGAGVEVIEEGHPGRTSVHDDVVEGEHRNGKRVLPAILESHAPVDLAVVMLGTNDFKTRYAVTPMDVAMSVEKLASMILDAGVAKLLLIAPPPVVEVGCLAGMYFGAAEKSQRFAAALAQAAERRGVGFLDAGRLIESSPLDGVHFEAAAHTKLGTAIAAVVSDMLG